MAGYAPVFRSILQSTIWEEQPHVKVVWWTMLLMCDRNGFVETTIPGLARSAVVTREQCLDAIARLSAPDPDSKTKTLDGRRIIEVEDGWKLVNHQKYKDKVGISSQANRERVANCRKAKKSQSGDTKRKNAKKRTQNTEANSDTLGTCNGCNDFPIGLGIGSPSQISSSDSENSPLAGHGTGQSAEPETTESQASEPTGPEKRQKSDHQALVDHYHDTFLAIRGAKPVIGGRETKAVKSLLSSSDGDLSRAKAIITNAYADPWWRDKATILSISNDPSKFVVNSRPTAKPEKWGHGLGNGPQPNNIANPVKSNEILYDSEKGEWL